MAERNRPGDAGDPADDEVFDDVVDDAESDEVEDAPVGRGGTAVAERTKGEPKKKKEARRTGFLAASVVSSVRWSASCVRSSGRRARSC
jgi:preprotein translocase subunit SecE